VNRPQLTFLIPFSFGWSRIDHLRKMLDDLLGREIAFRLPEKPEEHPQTPTLPLSRLFESILFGDRFGMGDLLADRYVVDVCPFSDDLRKRSTQKQ
jgi:hypothetical protein